MSKLGINDLYFEHPDPDMRKQGFLFDLMADYVINAETTRTYTLNDNPERLEDALTYALENSVMVKDGHLEKWLKIGSLFYASAHYVTGNMEDFESIKVVEENRNEESVSEVRHANISSWVKALVSLLKEKLPKDRVYKVDVYLTYKNLNMEGCNSRSLYKMNTDNRFSFYVMNDVE